MGGVKHSLRALRRRLPAVRHKTEDQANAALEYTHKRLRKLGLTLHPRKTRVAHADLVHFLGEPLVRRKLRENRRSARRG